MDNLEFTQREYTYNYLSKVHWSASELHYSTTYSTQYGIARLASSRHGNSWIMFINNGIVYEWNFEKYYTPIGLSRKALKLITELNETLTKQKQHNG